MTETAPSAKATRKTLAIQVVTRYGEPDPDGLVFFRYGRCHSTLETGRFYPRQRSALKPGHPDFDLEREFTTIRLEVV